MGSFKENDKDSSLPQQQRKPIYYSCERVYYLRNYADACKLHSAMNEFVGIKTKKAVVIGGGYIVNFFSLKKKKSSSPL